MPNHCLIFPLWTCPHISWMSAPPSLANLSPSVVDFCLLHHFQIGPLFFSTQTLPSQFKPLTFSPGVLLPDLLAPLIWPPLRNQVVCLEKEIRFHCLPFPLKLSPNSTALKSPSKSLYVSSKDCPGATGMLSSVHSLRLPCLLSPSHPHHDLSCHRDCSLCSWKLCPPLSHSTLHYPRGFGSILTSQGAFPSPHN